MSQVKKERGGRDQSKLNIPMTTSKETKLGRGGGVPTFLNKFTGGKVCVQAHVVGYCLPMTLLLPNTSESIFVCPCTVVWY